MTTPINIDPEQIQTMCNRIDAWAQEMKETIVSTVATRANQEVAAVQGLPGFDGQAATTYKAKFEEITTGINTGIQGVIEDITDVQLAGMREQLTNIGVAFQDLDTSFSF